MAETTIDLCPKCGAYWQCDCNLVPIDLPDWVNEPFSVTLRAWPTEDGGHHHPSLEELAAQLPATHYGVRSSGMRPDSIPIATVIT